MDGVKQIRESILGRMISSVCFVQNYYELKMDEYILRILATSHVSEKTQSCTFPEIYALVILHKCIGLEIKDFIVDGPLIVVEMESEINIRVEIGKSVDRETLHLTKLKAGSIII